MVIPISFIGIRLQVAIISPFGHAGGGFLSLGVKQQNYDVLAAEVRVRIPALSLTSCTRILVVLLVGQTVSLSNRNIYGWHFY
jgi:hypothetical protein